MECSSSHSQCESVAKSCSEAMMDLLMKLRADGSGGGQEVLNFVGLGAELTGQAIGWKELACGSAVSSLRRKNHQWQSRQSTVFECRSQEFGWVLRGLEYSSLSGQFSGVICVSQEIVMVWTWCPLVWVVPGSGDIHYIHVVMQPGSNHTLCNQRRQHVVVNILKSWIGIVPRFFNILLEWSVPLAENFLANDI